MSFGERLTALRVENGFTNRTDFAEKLGIPSTTLRNYETGVREPGHTFIRKVSLMFNISADYLLGLTNEKELLKPTNLTQKELRHIETYRRIDDFGRKTVELILDREAQRVEMTRIQSVDDCSAVCLSYLGKIAAAGYTVDSFAALLEGTIEVPDTPEARRADYAIGVLGDSMEPAFTDGDIVLVKKTDTVDIGKTGIFQKGNEIYIKQRGENGLHSINPAREDIFPDEDIYCLGEVIGKVQDPEVEK